LTEPGYLPDAGDLTSTDFDPTAARQRHDVIRAQAGASASAQSLEAACAVVKGR
jgi:hypothetical protein